LKSTLLGLGRVVAHACSPPGSAVSALAIAHSTAWQAHV
jgi:hypothetical protein